MYKLCIMPDDSVGRESIIIIILFIRLLIIVHAHAHLSSQSVNEAQCAAAMRHGSVYSVGHGNRENLQYIDIDLFLSILLCVHPVYEQYYIIDVAIKLV